MFGGRKRRVADAIYRSFKAVFTGGFYHLYQAQQHHLNELAEAWLYSEAYVHLAYVIYVCYGNIFHKRFEWATPELFMKATAKACEEEERESAPFEKGFAALLFKRIDEIEALTPDERMSGKPYLLSAQAVAKFDPSADIDKIKNELETAARNFLEELAPKLEALAN